MIITNIKTKLSKIIDMINYSIEDRVAIYKFYSKHKDYTIQPYLGE